MFLVMFLVMFWDICLFQDMFLEWLGKRTATPQMYYECHASTPSGHSLKEKYGMSKTKGARIITFCATYFHNDEDRLNAAIRAGEVIGFLPWLYHLDSKMVCKATLLHVKFLCNMYVQNFW